MRGSPVGCGQESVVYRWPQKWNASASPGATRLVTVPAPARPITVPDTRARKPRREVPAASRSLTRSGIHHSAASFGGAEHRLELRGGVEGALGEHRAVGVERHGERA